MNYDRAAMKMEVRQAMKQVRPHPMLVTLLFLVVVGAGSSVISGLVNTLLPGYNAMLSELVENILYYGEDYFEYVIETNPEMFLQLMGQMMIQAAVFSLVAGILTTIWSGLMDAGYAGYCLDMARGATPPLERVFSGFSRAGSVIPAYILVAVFTFLWSLLFGLAYGVVIVILSVILAVVDTGAFVAVYALLVLAATVGYVIATLWVTYRYAMVPFVIVNSPGPISPMDAINTSKALMKGRKGSYFVLQISFIGWYLLESLIVVIGLIISGASLFAIASSFISGLSYTDYMAILAGEYDFSALAVQMLGPVLIASLLCGAVLFILGLWLTPYRTGCNARFYTYAAGGAQPVPPGPSGGQPSTPYSGQPPIQPYGIPSGTPYGGSQPGTPSDSQPKPSDGSRSGAPYGGQPDPYGYTPPGQSSFGGYSQSEQPIPYGGSGYPQWGTPQTPEAPAAPAEPDDAQYETPYADESEASGDDTPQQPGGPNYPQY